MLRRVLAQWLVGFILVTSVPVPPSHSEPLPMRADLEERSSDPSAGLSAAAAVPDVGTPPQERGLGEDPGAGALVVTESAGEVVESQALPIEAASEPVQEEATARILSTTSLPSPGIQSEESRSAGAVQEVRPPRPPNADVAHAPDEAAVAARPEELALPAPPRLNTRPAVLRFALTGSGILPVVQRLEIASDHRQGTRFEVTGSGWLRVETHRGRAGLTAAAVQVAVDGRKVGGPVSGFLEVRNLDEPTDVQRISVEVERASPGRSLRSFDADGRLQRVIRPDGGILDYDYDTRGNLVRIRRPDGSAVTWSYDNQGRRIAMTDGRGTTVYRYDVQGRLDALYAPGFEPVRYGYDDRSRLTTLTLPGGRVVAWEYDETDRLLSVRSDLGTTRYSYDAVTRKLAERALPNGIVTRYGYDGAGRLTEVTHQDAVGQPLLSFAWSLDEQGRPVSVTRESATGRETTDLAYDEDGRIVSAALADGRIVTWEYDAAGRRSRETATRGADVQVTDYLYDDLGRLVRAGDETFHYDAAGDLVRRGAPGRTVEYRWDFEGRLTGFRDGKRKVAYEVDGDGRRVGVTVDGRTVSLLHDASGWIGGVLAEADADGAVLRHHVHGFEPIGVEGGEGQEGKGSFYLYDHPLRAAAALVSPAGDLAATFASDPFGAPLARPAEDLPPYLFAGGSYDPVTGLIHRDGQDYDPQLGTLLRSTVDDDQPQQSPRSWTDAEPRGAFSEALARAFRPDAPAPADRRDEPTANRTSGQDPPAGSTSPLHVTIFQSNELPPASSRSVKRSQALPSFYRLAPEVGEVYRRGELPERALESASPRLKLHPEYLPFAKTAAGLLPASQTLEITSSTGSSIAFSVAESIPWLTVSAAGGTTPLDLTVTVNPAGLTEQGSPYVGDLVLTNTADPSDVRKVRARLLVRTTGASVTLRSFDANGNLRRVIKPDGAVINYEVDALGRVTRIRYPDLQPVSYAYDGNGNQVSMTDHRGTTVYQYDRQNRLTGVFTPLGTNFIPVYYGYDKAGRLTRLATPDGRTVLYQYDADGRMTRVTDGADTTTYTYNGVTGQLTGQTLPNGIKTTYAYDVEGRLTDVVHKTATDGLLMSFHYTLNAVGQRMSVTKQTPTGSELTSYTYDELGQLKTVTYPGGRNVTYTYDQLGNRLSMTTVQGGNTKVVNYTYDKDNRLLRAGDEVFQYDGNGNMIRRSSLAGTTTFAYDARDLLTRVEAAGRVVSFEYDGVGRRTAKVVNGERVNFINDEGALLPQALLEAGGSWQVLASYTYGLQRVSRRATGGSQFYLVDSKSVVALADGSGNLSTSFTYDDFGSPGGGPPVGGFLFDGEAFDAETHMIYLRARYYDPRLARFISRDSFPVHLREPGRFSSYVFCKNDPINCSDPFGLFEITSRLGVSGRINPWGLGELEVGVAASAGYNDDVGFNSGGSLYAEGKILGDFATLGFSGGVDYSDKNGTEGKVDFYGSAKAAGYGGTFNIDILNLVTGNGDVFSGSYGPQVSLPDFSAGVERVTGVKPNDVEFGFDNDYNMSLDVSFGAPIEVKVFKFKTNLSLEADFGIKMNLRDDIAVPLKGALEDAWDWVVGSDAGGASPTQAAALGDGLLSGASAVLGGGLLDGVSAGLGGVSLNKTADLLLSLQDITGATFDEATGQLVLLGKDSVSLPPLEMNHMAVAVQSVFGGQDPGVSIDPPIVNNQMSVRYEGQTRNTEFGEIMFEADRVLKILTLGKDNLTGQTVTSQVPGYKNMLRRRLDAGCGTMPNSTRMWFQPKQVRLVPSTDGKSMVFDAVSMELLYESKVGNQVVSDPQAAAFASHFTQNYAAFANEWPILKKLEQLGKVVAVIKWIKDNRIPIDLSFLDNYPIEFFSTVTSTPIVTVQGQSQSGPLICTVSLQGGVTYEVPNQYLTATSAAGAALNEALGHRPSEGAFKWTYQPASAGGLLTAVAESLTRSRRDGNVRFQEVDLTDPLPGGGALSLVRTYNSFFDRGGPLGAGWSVLPAELRFPLKKERFTFGSSNLALDLYARIWLAERTAGREDAYDLLGIDSTNLPIYRRADAMHLLRQQTDGTFRLTREDGSAVTFRADGRPASFIDRNGNSVSFVYDTQTPARLLRLEAGARSITLTYDGQGRISQASGPGGRQVVYGFNAQGRLSAVTDFAAQSRSYGYDTNGRLTSATDAEGRTVFTASYDDYDRTPVRRLGSAAQYGFDFDLGSGESTVTDAFGRIIRRLFERVQLASPSGIRNEVLRPRETEDPLGNRTKLTWANDAFGPRTVTDTQGATTELAWDNRGHLTKVRNALGRSSERFYDWRDRLVAVRDPEGLARAFGYDDKNNPVSVYHDVALTLDASGNLTSFAYDPANVSTFAYDAAGNLTAAANPLGQQAQVQHNAQGQPTRITSPGGVVTNLGYDTRSRLTSSQTGSLQMTYGYDNADRVTSITTAAGTTSFLRDVHGRVTRLRDALLRDTLYGYNTDGRLIRVDDAASGVTTYTYDVLGRLLSASLPNGTSNAWEYDELGRPVATLTGLGAVTSKLALATESLDFGTVAVGSSRQLPLDLYNQGTAPLTISGITVSAPFFVTFSGPAVIQPAGSLRVTVTYTPTDQVPASANLSITSDDPATPLVLVSVSGEGARKVVNLQAAAAQEGIQLTWSPFNAGSRPFGRFNIYRSLTPIPGDVTGLSPFNTSLTSPSATSFLDKLATPGTSYYYAVTPVYANGEENKSVDPAGPVAYFTTFGPLAVDGGVATAAQSENRPAIAYNSTANEYLVVYERQTSATNLDVYGQRVSAAGALVGSAFAIASTSSHERRPRLAYNANSNNYLVIWEFDQSGNGSNYNLQAKTVSSVGSLGSNFNVASHSRHELAPEIAFGSTSREYLVSYEWDSDGDGKTDLCMLRLSATGSLLASVQVRMPGSAAGTYVNATNPHLAYNSTANEFMVAVERDLAGNGSNIEIWETRFKPDLTLVVAQIFAVAQSAGHDRNPHLTYDSVNNEYLAVWEADATGAGTNHDIYVRKLTSAGALSGILLGLSNAADSDRNPRAVYNRNLDDFVMVWEIAGTTPKIMARRAHITVGTVFMQAPVEVSSGTASRVRPDVGTSTQSNTFLTVWEQDAGSGNFDVRSRLLGTFTPTLQVSPASLTFSGATTQQTLTVTNSTPSGGPLQWTAVPDRSWMTAQPGSGSTTSSVAVNVTVDRTGLAPGSYTGTIRVSSNNGSSNVAVTLNVGNTSPDVPNTPRPVDGAIDQASVAGGVGLTLGWQGGDADGDTVTWAVYLSTDSGRVTSLDPTVRVAQGLTIPSLQPAGLTYLKQYFWRIVATDSRGASTTGPVWQFTTAAVAPPELHPVMPDPTRETRPALTWQAVTGAATYHLQAAGNAGFSPLLIDQTGITATSLTPAAPLPEGTIHWRVRSRDAAGQPGAFSGADTFVIDTTAAGIPVLVPVTPDPTNDPQPALAWSAVSGASSYRVQVAGSAGFASPIVDTTVSTLTYQPVSSLPEGSIDWRVASLDEAGNQSAFSGADQFTLDTTPPPAIAGLTAHRQGGGVALAWQPLAGPLADFSRFRIYRAEAPFTNVSGITLLNESLTSAAAVSFQDATASSGVAYWYAVTAVDSAGNENREVTPAHVLANEPPAAPVLVAPAVGAQVLPSGTMTVPLAWSASDPENDPLRFEVYLSTDSSQVDGTPDITARIAENLAAPLFDAPGLTYQKTYYWRVAALDLAPDGTVRSATFGPLWSFAIPAIPAPVLTAQTPDPSNQVRPTFTWLSVPGAAGYRIEIASDPAFGSTLLATEVTETSFTPPNDLPEGSLRWRVRAIDAQGLPGAFSAVDDFVLDITAPTVPVPVPVTPDPTNNRRPTLTWGSVADASSYRVQASTDAVFTSPLIDTTVSSPVHALATDLPEGRIYWRVSSQDAAGNQSAFSAADDFLVDATAPPVPVLVAVTPDPTNNRRPNLAWGNVADASSYQVQVATDAGFASPLIDTTMTSPAYVPGADLPEGRIYWRVSSKDVVGNQSTFSAADDFLVDATAPQVPVLVTVTPDPTNNRRPNLTWGSVADASSYQLQISTDPSFSSLLVNVAVAGASYAPASDLPEGSIYWRVASEDSLGNRSAFSAADDFLVDVTPPAVPVPVAVAPDSTNNPRPLLAWSAIGGATSYRVQVSTGADFTTLLAETTVALNSYQPGSDLPEGRIYWRVASRDAVGNQSAFSAASSFTVDRTPPPAVTGLVADWASPGTHLVWDAIPGSVTDVAHLHVFRSSSPFTSVTGLTPLATLSNPLATSFSDTTAPHGVVHHYAVTAVDQAGNQLTAVTSAATPPPGGDLYTVAPCRVLDTRNPDGPFGGPSLTAGQPRSFALAGRCGIPATATAIVGNLSVFSPPADGFLKAYEGGVASPNASALYFAANLVRANNVVLKVQGDGTGTLVLEAVVPAGIPVNAFLDVSGYFE